VLIPRICLHNKRWTDLPSRVVALGEVD
jgi:hypothetical protein